MAVSLLAQARGLKNWWAGAGGIKDQLNTWGDAINELITNGVTSNLAFSATSTTSAINVALASISNVNTVNFTATGKTLTLPSASGSATVYDGGSYRFYNVGANSFTLLDKAGGTITTIEPNTVQTIECSDDTTVAGSWLIGNIYRDNVKISNNGFTLTIEGAGLTGDRTVLLGNQAGTIVTTVNNQTLTNKELAAGTVFGAAIDGANFGIFATFRPIDTQDAAQAFALADAGRLQLLTGSTNRTWTIPAAAAVAFTAGTELDIFNDGTGDLTLTAAGGVTVNGVTAGSITLGANEGGVLKLTATANRWIFMGDRKTEWA